MDESEIVKTSLLNNIQELSEFLAYDMHINSYYDLVDKLVNLHNFRAKVYKKDKSLYEEIKNEIEKSDEYEL